jgi:two-component system, cell cycle sensor histidine kinase and response regulator CckA
MSRQIDVESHPRGRMVAEQFRQVLQVARGLSVTLGNDFFQSVVRNLATTFNADCVYLGQLSGSPANHLTTLAVFRKRQKAENFDQTLTGTAARQVGLDGSFACSRGVRRRFPEDRWLETMRAEGYVGVRLSDSAGQPVGLLAVVSKFPLPEIHLVKSVLETFAPRAAAEIERKRAEDLHKENEQRYHAFVSTNPDAMWRIEFEEPIPLDSAEEEQLERIYRTGYLAECNAAAARLYSWGSAEQFVGARFSEIFSRKNLQLLEELRTAIRSGFRSTVIETTAQDDAGRQVYRLRSHFGIVEDGGLRRLWGTTRDITDLRRAELSAAASEHRFREVLEGIQLPALMLDGDGRITFCNECFLRLANRSRKELSAPKWLEGIVSTEEGHQWKAAMLHGKEGSIVTRHIEGEILQREGPPRTVLWDTINLHQAEGETTTLAAIGRDLSYQRALEAQIRLSQKLDSVGRLAAGIAHDFSDILTLVRGHTEQLLQEVAQSGKAHESLSAIEDGVMRCSDLVGQLLAFSRKQPLRPERIDLNDVITAEETLIRSLLGADIELTIKQTSPLWLVYADPIQFQRILANLVTNARDAMPQGGTLSIESTNLVIGEDDAAHPGVMPGAYVQISVSDTGVGLPEEVEAHLFEPFFTTKEAGRGSGLGLPTVYGIVTQSGGYVAVHTEPGKGTTVELLLPAVARTLVH